MEIYITQQREKSKLSSLQLSRMTGIPKSTLYEIESGKRSPRLDQLEKIAIALSCRMSDLFDSEYK